jgi:Lecithin retinol acyltransferase
MSASSASTVAIESLAPGTELIVDRLGYRHHGIYLGAGLVIHYAGGIRYSHGLIETIPVRDFVGGHRVRPGCRPVEPLHGEDIVRRALSRLGERRYNIFRNNCEHFCSWCQFGESRSKQVDFLRQRIQLVKRAARRLLMPGCRSNVRGGLQLAFSLNPSAANHRLRFSAAGLPAQTSDGERRHLGDLGEAAAY